MAGLKAFAARTGKSLDVAAPVLAQTLKWYLSNVASAMAKRHGSPRLGGTTGTTLSIRSGSLINSIKQSVPVDGGSVDSLRGYIGAGVPYARIQEFGGAISQRQREFKA